MQPHAKFKASDSQLTQTPRRFSSQPYTHKQTNKQTATAATAWQIADGPRGTDWCAGSDSGVRAGWGDARNWDRKITEHRWANNGRVAQSV
jgi:hypothetical protein